MKHYDKRADLKKAIADAIAGKQSLFTHVWGLNVGPPCFHGAQIIGKLFDQDTCRLLKTARAIGMSKVKIDRQGTPKQHIDLVGEELNRALALAKSAEDD